MSKFKLLFFLAFVFCVQLQAQDKMTEIITLKTGEKYQGEIVLRTDDVVMLRTSDGKRYQFQISEIERIGLKNTVQSDENSGENTHQGNFAGIIDVTGGLALAPFTLIDNALTMSATLAFGSRNAFGTSAFAGVGAGYVAITGTEKSENLTYIPLFLQAFVPLQNSRISPAIGTKAGYSFTLSEQNKGGPFFNLSGGISYKITTISSLYVGFYGQAQGISGTVIETNELGEFTKQGNAMIFSLGLNAAFLF